MWAPRRAGGGVQAVIAGGGHAGAGNGPDSSAVRGHGQQPAAGQHVDPRPHAGVLQELRFTTLARSTELPFCIPAMKVVDSCDSAQIER